MIKIIHCFLAFIVSVFSSSAYAQYEGLLYGEVILKDRSIVTGPIRWSGGQMLWADILLVSKAEQRALKYLSKNQLSALSGKDELDWEFMSLWKEKLPERQHELLCRFGDIASVHVTGPNQAQIYLKNGSKLRVVTDQRENRHLGKDIAVYDGNLRKISWDKISRVNFRNSPGNFEPLKGQLLYGTVSTTSGEFSGFIQWDKTKFLTSQKLEGKPNDQVKTDEEYPFEIIEGIEKRDRGAVIRFKSDKKLFLKNNRDVSSSNRGIVVMHPVWGRAIIEWEAFKSVRFTDAPRELGYSAYSSPKRIYSILKSTDGKVFKGNSTFDLDEEWNVELLEGSSQSIHYQIPFKYIKSIATLANEQSRVTLANDKVISLGNHNDVTSKNWGMIIWQANSQHVYIPWTRVREITFR